MDTAFSAATFHSAVRRSNMVNKDHCGRMRCRAVITFFEKLKAKEKKKPGAIAKLPPLGMCEFPHPIAIRLSKIAGLRC